VANAVVPAVVLVAVAAGAAGLAVVVLVVAVVLMVLLLLSLLLLTWPASGAAKTSAIGDGTGALAADERQAACDIARGGSATGADVRRPSMRADDEIGTAARCVGDPS
jgi:hypothetical protein